MSRRLLVATVVAALAGLLPGTASADGEAGFLVVEGRGGTTTTWDVASPVFLKHGLPEEIAGGGEYAAVLVERLAANSQVRLGAVRVRAFRDGTGKAYGLLGDDAHLEPGRYRVTLLGAGPVRFRYSLTSPSAPGIRVQPRTRIPVRFLGRSEQLTAGLSSARIDLPRQAPTDRRVIQVGLFDGLALDDARMCATTAADCPAPPLQSCPPGAVPCGDPVLVPTRVGTGTPAVDVLLHEPRVEARALRWSVDGYRDEPGKLRAAAIIF